jgi:hypothetical protein
METGTEILQRIQGVEYNPPSTMTGEDIATALDAYLESNEWRGGDAAMTGDAIVTVLDAYIGPAWRVPGMPIPASDGAYYVVNNGNWAKLGVVTYVTSGGDHCRVVTDNIPTSWENITNATDLNVGPGVFVSSYALSNSSITNLNISSIDAVGSYAANGNTTLTTATINAPIIGDYAFAGISSLASVNLTVAIIGSNAFNGCNLSSLTLNAGLTTIGAYAFENNTSLNSVTLPDSLLTVGEGAFYGCSALASVTLPTALEIIEGFAFGGTGIMAITLPNTLTTIGERAFALSQLSSITIPESIVEIATEAFYGCGSLTSLNILTDSPPTTGVDAFDMTGLSEVHVPTAATGWPSLWQGLTVVQDL